MSDYEKQLEEANQRLREQLEKETARADMLEQKLTDIEIRNEKPKNQYSQKDIVDEFQKLYEQIQKKKNKF